MKFEKNESSFWEFNSEDYFYTVGERNQFYIDGGIFLMNLL